VKPRTSALNIGAGVLARAVRAAVDVNSRRDRRHVRTSKVGRMLKRTAVWVLGAALGCDGSEPNSGLQPGQGGSSAEPSGGQGGTNTPSDALAGSGGSSAAAGRGNSLGGASAQGGTSGSGGSVTSGGAAGNEQTQCLEPGQLDCSDTALCCDGAMCIADGTTIVCAALCESSDGCNSGCCAPVDETNSVCAPADFCAPPVDTCSEDTDCDTACCLPVDAETSVCAPSDLCAAPPAIGCGNLVLLANDGTYLGDATSNQFAADGVCNEFSQYGSQFAATSIFNQFGQYGSQFSTLSAYNEFTTTPPVLYCVGNDTVLNPVSKNTFLAGAIDPDFLCAVLAQNGL
jgi:hypothetical protein